MERERGRWESAHGKRGRGRRKAHRRERSTWDRGERKGREV